MAAVLPGSGFTSAIFVFQSLHSLFCLVVMDSAAWLSNDTQLFFLFTWVVREKCRLPSKFLSTRFAHMHSPTSHRREKRRRPLSSQDRDSFNRLCRFIADCLIFS